jgi:tetratricopeptide (TPR) repeat protein
MMSRCEDKPGAASVPRVAALLALARGEPALEFAQVALAAALESADSPTIAEAERVLGRALLAEGDNGAALEHTLNALEMHEKGNATRSLNYLHALAQAAMIENATHGASGAQPLARQARELSRVLGIGPGFVDAALEQAMKAVAVLAE